MKKYIFISIIIFNTSCTKVEDNSDNSSFFEGIQSDKITFIIDLSINENSSENLDNFISEITQNVLDKEDFCLEYAYYLSEDKMKVTLYEKYIDSKGALQHGQNFMESPYFERFFNLFSIEKFVVTGPASDEFKKFASDNEFEIEYQNLTHGFKRK